MSWPHSLHQVPQGSMGAPSLGIVGEIGALIRARLRRLFPRRRAAEQSSTGKRLHAPMKDVAGHVAFISGGSSGIGLGIAAAFAAAGMKVVIGYLTTAHLQNARKCLAEAGNRVHAIEVDVTDRAQVEAAAAETQRIFGKIHVLVCNAGVAVVSPLCATSYADWDWTMAVNLNGAFNCVHAFLPYIREHGEGGQIMAVSSMSGLYAAGIAGAYTTSKFAVVGMMEALRAELTDVNIGVSVCCPGLVKSNIAIADRNNPTRVSDASLREDSNAYKTLIEKMNNPELAIDPLDVGLQVLQGLRRNDLYILTHAEYEQIVRAREAALLAAFPRGLQPTKARAQVMQSLVENSIYR